MTSSNFAAIERPARGALIDRGEHPEWRQFLILAALQRSEEINRLRDLPDTPARLPAIPDVAPPYVPAELSMKMPQGKATAPNAAGPKLAGLPSAHREVDPGDETGSINVGPDATMPIEIGEPSSTELPVQPTEDKPPVSGIPSASAPVIDAPETQPADFDKPTAPAEPPVLALAPATHTDPIVVVIRKPTARHHVARRTPAPAKAETYPEAPPPFNLLQALFASFARKPEEPPAKAVRKTVARPIKDRDNRQGENAPRRVLTKRASTQ